MEEELLQERLALAKERIEEMGKEALQQAPFSAYFKEVARFLKTATAPFVLEENAFAACKVHNETLYAPLAPDVYETSFLNPAFACAQLGEAFGPLLSFLYKEMVPVILAAGQQDLWEEVVRLELFLEVYTAFVYAAEEDPQEGLPKAEDIRQSLYWFFFDYADEAALRSVKAMVLPKEGVAYDILTQANLTDLRYLFAYGEPIGKNEIEMAAFLNDLPEETIAKMADTYTEGYRLGFAATGKDLSIKKTAELVYPIGFERMLRRAVANLEALGLSCICRPAAHSLFYGARGIKSSAWNRQFLYDHKEDIALILDKGYVNRRAEVLQTAFEEYKEAARGYAGPAVVETFGEAEFAPKNKVGCVKLSKKQQKLQVQMQTKLGALQRNYIIEEERSFTIIAFPIPEITPDLPVPDKAGFAEFFEEIIRVNTLDYTTYQRIQQTLIDALDKADHCEIKGLGKNETNLQVQLYKKTDPATETTFENCVADVNIPVGEVFTSPVLEGTEGLLHVSRVYLNGLEYKDLKITFQDGMIASYACKNFPTEAENAAYIAQNILFHHPTLPMGEFAIGTNTTAYTLARKYGVQAKLPILIAEKTGPHFAVGDTCYSHEEDMITYNPDGKRIVARENTCSVLRHTDPDKAYFNCHTDITIPYDELGSLTAVCRDGMRIPIIEVGRFVLPGTEELNAALED